MKKYLAQFITVIVSTMAVVGTVSAVTTISTNISTGGSLSVTGTSTMLGIVSVGSSKTSVAPFFVDGTLPKLVATLPAGYYSDFVLAKGNYLYGAHTISSNNLGFSIYDITDPKNPILATTTILQATCNFQNPELRSSGQYIFIFCNQDVGGSGAVLNDLTINVSDPYNPIIFQGRNNGANMGKFAWGFDLAGRYLYAGGVYQFNIFDISDPHNQILVGTLRDGSVGYTTDVIVRGNYAYAVDGNNSKFYVVNIQNPSAPTLSSSMTFGALYGSNQIALSGNYVYTQNSGDLSVINISSSTASIVATISVPGGIVFPLNTLTSGHYLYTNTANGLAVYDISNPVLPAIVGTIPAITTAISINGRYMYTANGTVYDLGGGYMQRLSAGDVNTDSLEVAQPSAFLSNINAFGGINIGAAGLNSFGPGSFSGDGGANVLSVTAATTTASNGKGTSFDTELIRNFATSSTASIIKSGLNIQSIGIWSGTAASNIGLYVSSVSGGTNNYDAIFHGGGAVGIGTSTPTTQFQVATSTSNATTSIEIGKAGQNKGSCLVMYDATGAAQYVSISSGGSFVISTTTSCR